MAARQLDAPETSSGRAQALLLVITPHAEDERFFRQNIESVSIRVSTVSGQADAMRSVAETCPDLVVCDEQLPDGDWKSVLDQLDSVAGRPRLIVSSRLADESLWAEVLNLGAYDLLAKPFDAMEAVRVISFAFTDRLAPGVCTSRPPGQAPSAVPRKPSAARSQNAASGRWRSAGR